MIAVLSVYITSLLSATVIAYTAMDADAYATACMVMGLNESVAFINAHPDLEALFISLKNVFFELFFGFLPVLN